MALTFPLVDRKSIVEFLVNIRYTSIGEQDLLKPTRDAMLPLYEFLMQYLMGVSREDLQQPAFGGLECLADAELHEESVGCLAFMRNITKVMQTCNVPEFSLNDIFKPEPKSTVCNLSAIINFAKFKEERDEGLAELINEKERHLEQREQAAQKAQRIKAEVLALRAAQQAAEVADAPVVLALQDEVKQMKQQIVGKKKRYAALQVETRAHKEEYIHITDQVSQEKFRISEAKQIGAELKAQIVQSPEKLQKAVEEKKKSLDKAIQYAEEKRLSTRSIKNKQEANSKAEEKVKKCVAILQDYEKQTAEHKQVSKELKALRAKVKECKKERLAYETKVAQSRLEGQHLMEQAEKLGRQATFRLKEVQRDLQAFVAQHSPTLANLRDRSAQLIRSSEELDQELVHKLSDMEAKKGILLSKGAAEVAGLMQKVHDYNKGIYEALSV